MKFIHTSDIHLGNPFVGVRSENINQLRTKLLSATLDSFSAMVDYAIVEEVDFILVSGDLINQTNQSVLVQTFLDEQLNRLETNNINLYLSINDLDDIETFKNNHIWSNKIHIFSPITNGNADINLLTTKDKKRVAIVGFSDSKQNEPGVALDAFVARDKNLDYQIGVYYDDSQSNNQSQSFNLDQMIATNYDYWALGGQHNQNVLNQEPFVGYSGSLQGLNKNEPGPKGFLLVEDDQEGKLTPRFVPTAPIEWQNMIADIDDVTDQNQLINAIVNTLQNQPPTTVFQLLSIDLNSSENLPENLADKINDGTILEQLNLQLTGQFDQFFASNIYLNYTKQTVQLNNLDNRYWEVAIDNVFSKENIDQKLFGINDDFIRDYFSDIETIDNIQSRAQTRLLNNQNRKTVENEF